MWAAVRWQTYNLMCVSMADMKKAGIQKPTDLIQFPWEKEKVKSSSMPTEADIAEMQAMMREMNAQNEESGK